MALWELDEFKPASLLGFIRAVPAPDNFKAQTWLPNRPVTDLEFKYILGANNKPVMAHIMGFESEAPIHGRPGLGEQVEGELPPIKRKAKIGEKEIIQFLAPRTGLPDVDNAINSVYQLLADLSDAVQARIEWLRVQAVTEDKVVYSEGGAIFNFDFGLNDLFQITLGATAGTAVNGAGATEASFGKYWSDTANSTPVDDLQFLAQRIGIATGQALARTVMSLKSLNYLYRNASIRLLVRGPNSPTALLTRAELDAVFAQYGIPPIETYDVVVSKENADGTYSDVRPMRENAVTMLPAQPGETLLGPTAEARVLYGTPLAAQAPGVWAETYGTTEPPAEWTKVAATAFPTLPGANAIGQMTVYP